MPKGRKFGSKPTPPKSNSKRADCTVSEHTTVPEAKETSTGVEKLNELMSKRDQLNDELIRQQTQSLVEVVKMQTQRAVTGEAKSRLSARLARVIELLMEDK